MFSHRKIDWFLKRKSLSYRWIRQRMLKLNKKIKTGHQNVKIDIINTISCVLSANGTLGLHHSNRMAVGKLTFRLKATIREENLSFPRQKCFIKTLAHCPTQSCIQQLTRCHSIEENYGCMVNGVNSFDIPTHQRLGSICATAIRSEIMFHIGKSICQNFHHLKNVNKLVGMNLLNQVASVNTTAEESLNSLKTEVSLWMMIFWIKIPYLILKLNVVHQFFSCHIPVERCKNKENRIEETWIDCWEWGA